MALLPAAAIHRIQDAASCVARDGARVTLRVAKADTARVAERLLANLPIVDLTIEDPPIEDVIEQVFAQEAEPVPA